MSFLQCLISQSMVIWPKIWDVYKVSLFYAKWQTGLYFKTTRYSLYFLEKIYEPLNSHIISGLKNIIYLPMAAKSLNFLFCWHLVLIVYIYSKNFVSSDKRIGINYKLDQKNLKLPIRYKSSRWWSYQSVPI